VTRVVVFDRDGIEIATVEVNDKGDVEFVMLDIVVAEPVNGAEEATGLAAA
jgi:hypothetical protein